MQTRTQVKIELTINGENLDAKQLRKCVADALSTYFVDDYVNRHGTVEDIHLSLDGHAGLSVDCQT